MYTALYGVDGIAPERLQQALDLPPHDARIGRRDGDAGVAIAGRVLRRAAAEDQLRGERRDAVRVRLLRRRHRRHGARRVHRGAADRALAGDVLAQSRACRQAAAGPGWVALRDARLRAPADGLLSRRLRHLRRAVGLRGGVDSALCMWAAFVCSPARDLRQATCLTPAWKSTSESGGRRRAGVASMAWRARNTTAL